MMYGRSTSKAGRGGVWAQARRVPRDQNWWRFNALAFAGFVKFLNQRYPEWPAFSRHESWNGGSWWIERDGSVAFFSGGDRMVPSDRTRPHLVTGRMVRRHGVSESFMNYLADHASDPEAADQIYRAPGPAWQRGGVKLDVVARCRHGHDLTDPANVYTLTRTRGRAQHVERRCRACNRARVAQHRARVSGSR